MRRMLIAGLAAFAGLAGWTGHVGAGLFSATEPVIVILAGDLPPGKSVAANLTVTGPMVPAPEAAPDALLSAAILVVTSNLKQDENLQTNKPAKIAELVESAVLPLFDFRRMTELAVARNWRLASPEQQNSLIAGFMTLLVRTYSTALANYGDRAIEYKPLRIAPGETLVTVKSTMRQPGAERITIDYCMEKTTAGWKVFDIKIAGISLVTTYRSTFAQIIRDGGVEGLIESLSAKNRQADFGLASGESGARPLLFMYAVIPGVTGAIPSVSGGGR